MCWRPGVTAPGTTQDPAASSTSRRASACSAWRSTHAPTATPRCASMRVTAGAIARAASATASQVKRETSACAVHDTVQGVADWPLMSQRRRNGNRLGADRCLGYSMHRALQVLCSLISQWCPPHVTPQASLVQTARCRSAHHRPCKCWTARATSPTSEAPASTSMSSHQSSMSSESGLGSSWCGKASVLVLALLSVAYALALQALPSRA